MRLSNFNLGPGLFLIGYHLLLLIALPLYFMHASASFGMWLTSFFLLYATGLSITAGYHRLFSHKTYKVHPLAKALLLFFGTMATQGSAIRWSFEHRLHHSFVDTDRDPYSIKKGFWYAHFLWLFEKPKPIDKSVVADLYRDPVLRFQDRYYPYLMIGTNILSTLALGLIFHDFLSAFVISWILRMFFLHHFTWFINSLAHTWGSRTFCKEQTAADNYIISLLTFGEGYHNYHHTFAFDYRNGIRWFHFDPTKWLIWTLQKLGLAYNLKKVHDCSIQEKLVLDRKQLLLQKLHSSYDSCIESMEEKITKISESLLAQFEQFKQLSTHYQRLKAQKAEKKEYLAELENQLKEIKKSLSIECRQWTAIERDVMKNSAC